MGKGDKSVPPGESQSLAERVENIEGRMGDFEAELGEVKGEVKEVRRDYQELRRETKALNESQVRLQTYMEVGFKRNDEQNQQILNTISRLTEQIDNAELHNQERHQEMIQMIYQGDRENSRETAEGDRQNLNALNERKWNAKTTLLTTIGTVAVIAVGIATWWFSVH